jgi:hypothetical protein
MTPVGIIIANKIISLVWAVIPSDSVRLTSPLAPMPGLDDYPEVLLVELVVLSTNWTPLPFTY